MLNKGGRKLGVSPLNYTLAIADNNDKDNCVRFTRSSSPTRPTSRLRPSAQQFRARSNSPRSGCEISLRRTRELSSASLDLLIGLRADQKLRFKTTLGAAKLTKAELAAKNQMLQ